MTNKDLKEPTNRRHFLGTLATGAAAVSLASLTPSLNLHAEEKESPFSGTDDPEAWFNKIKGKHRVVFDATESKSPPDDIMPLAWPRIFLITNSMTGTPDKDQSVVIVLRHAGIFYGLEDRVWSKYKLGETFKLTDRATNAPAVRNQYWKPKPGYFKVPGIGNVAIGVNELQDSGVMFCICNMALTVYSAIVADGMKMKPEDVYNDWKSAVFPGIQIVPSGVWAVGRAQEHGCKYIFAG